MSEQTFGNGRQNRDKRGNQNQYRNNNRSGGGGRRDGKKGGRGSRNDNNYRNRGRSHGDGRNWASDNWSIDKRRCNWSKDNDGAGNWTSNQNNEQSRFPKFRESNTKYEGTRHMDDYERNSVNNNDQSNQQAKQQQNHAAGHQSPIEHSKMTDSPSMKQTVVKDLTDENAILSNSTAANVNESALTGLRKKDSLPLRFPMETIESQLPKIKIEKVDAVISKTPPKPEMKPTTSSSSSSSSDEEVEAPNQKTPKVDDKKAKSKLKTENKAKPAKPAYSSDEEEESSEAASSSSEEQIPASKAVATNSKSKKSKKFKSDRKQNSDEDVMCLGKVKNKISLDDEDADSDAASSKSKKANDNCLLCDKQGHTSLECQMICKNCSKPYHNLKSCPHPPNLTVMMQNFMEFLLQQMAKFNPQAAFPFDQHLRAGGASLEHTTVSQPLAPSSPAVSSTHGKRKRSQIAAKVLEAATKKPAKKRRHQKTTKKTIDSDEASSASPSDSETSSDSSEAASIAHDRKKLKNEKSFINAFPGQLAMPGYGTLPPYGAATAFNPMLPMLNQMMHNGYPVHGAFNFKQ